MVKHIEITNDARRVIIDDQFSVPMLIAKATVRTTRLTDNPRPPGFYRIPFFATLPWTGNIMIKRGKREAFDIELPLISAAATLAEQREIMFKFSSSLIVAGRCADGDYATIPIAYFFYYADTDEFALFLEAQHELQGGVTDVVVYAAGGIRPKRETLAVFNSDGKLLFDARMPPLMYIGSIYGQLEVWRTVAGTFTINLPPDVDKLHVYVTQRSGAPFYSAYNIHSGGVSYGQTTFKKIITFPVPGKVAVQYVRVNYVEGSNSAYGYGGCFENIIYCPYPEGAYI